ncbi:AvrD family protein [Nocardiopsis sp. LOL_012]|uniref:AvrD family protein n=1 Tax=Nocardiopsis sp. LOL_012 TaxID=3345409 RepID=UPI003A8A0874
MNSAPTPTFLSSVDDQLGPSEKRFFGKGFRRVSYEHTDIRVTRTTDVTNDVRVTSSLAVRYPDDWSKKGAKGQLPPHFSTIDGLVTAAELSELCIAGDGPAGTERAWLRSVRISAGTTPMEDLGDLRAHAVRRSREPSRADPSLWVSLVDCTVGTMRTRCEVVHPATDPVPGEHVHASPDALLGPAEQRYFGQGFRSRRQEIRNVSVDPGGLRAEADLALAGDGPHPWPTSGLEAAHQPSVTMVDAFVTALQLAQVMLYDLDGMRRADSDTLWMRRTAMSAARPDRPTGHGVRVDTAIEHPLLLETDDAVWRTADIVGDLGGVHVDCAVAHRLRTA